MLITLSDGTKREFNTLTRANLMGADLGGADLTGVILS